MPRTLRRPGKWLMAPKLAFRLGKGVFGHSHDLQERSPAGSAVSAVGTCPRDASVMTRKRALLLAAVSVAAFAVGLAGWYGRWPT